MENAIEIRNVGKKYKIAHQRGKYVALRDVITNIIKRPLSYFKTKAKAAIGRETLEDFWAVKDIDLTIKRGEIVGIIGANGAGKSTLLKILSRITPPTTGEIILNGRLASLLEVGTGFHPELTGRENIFLNGAILGMTKKEIVERFDGIVEFSGVRQFLDTPVKHYSSGMYVRLAFAVAAHMEPDILIVDEVLAVGDAEFQKKCLGKMEEVSKKEGRTILFVSHNMNAIQKLCTKTVLMEKGRVVAFGKTEDVINQYLERLDIRTADVSWKEDKKPGDDIAILHSARIVDEHHEKVPYAITNKKVGIEFTYEILKEGLMPIPNIHIFTSKGDTAFINHESPDPKLRTLGVHRSTMWIPANLLNEGTYVAGIALSSMNPLRIHFYQPDALVFDVLEGTTEPRTINFNQRIPGAVRPLLEWENVTA